MGYTGGKGDYVRVGIARNGIFNLPADASFFKVPLG